MDAGREVPPRKLRVAGHDLAIAYQIATIVILCDKTPPFGTSFFDRWFVPISAAIVAAIGILYYVIVRPKRQVLDPAES